MSQHCPPPPPPGLSLWGPTAMAQNLGLQTHCDIPGPAGPRPTVTHQKLDPQTHCDPQNPPGSETHCDTPEPGPTDLVGSLPAHGSLSTDRAVISASVGSSNLQRKAVKCGAQ
ncbi:hypothetical protein AAFF_G00388130 [Aldrovandia affinis]|uniref:Uncharacterized protein n=1 Tax=Aldrovandia affinis TaxID=143900 RepID=A0AAD7WLB8_9TELE|nr:hypothetical protein AAFF_G00388130 [Aldrovandia affinis]